MKNFLDDYPQDWTNPKYNQLCDYLIGYANNSKERLSHLADLAGMVHGGFPNYPEIRTICIELIQEMGRQGKLRQLVEEAAKQGTVYDKRFTEMLTLPARPASYAPSATESHADQTHLQALIDQQYLSDELYILDRMGLRTQLKLLVSETNPVKVLLVRGGPRSGKSHTYHLFERLAKDRGAQPVYLFDGIVDTVDDVIEELFNALEASQEIPPRNTTENAWYYKHVCRKLQEIAARKNRQLWVMIDDLGVDQYGIPKLGQEKSDGIDIRQFCEQFALRMMNPAFRKWFRLMLIDYPEGPVPTRWRHEFWREDRTSIADIQQEHVMDFLRSWQTNVVKRTIIEDELKLLANLIIEEAETHAGEQANEMGRLYEIKRALDKVVKEIREESL